MRATVLAWARAFVLIWQYYRDNWGGRGVEGQELSGNTIRLAATSTDLGAARSPAPC